MKSAAERGCSPSCCRSSESDRGPRANSVNSPSSISAQQRFGRPESETSAQNTFRSQRRRRHPILLSATWPASRGDVAPNTRIGSISRDLRFRVSNSRTRLAAVTQASFGTLLRESRLKAGLTQEALAERSGLGIRSIQGLERGESHPRRETAATSQRGAAALG